MSSDAPELIRQAVEHFLDEVPALRPLPVVIDLELKGRGDIQAFQGEMPDLKITKGVADHARVRLEVPRADFNTLATKGTVEDWLHAFEVGTAKASGDSAMLKLIAQVTEKQVGRNRLSKGRSGA